MKSKKKAFLLFGVLLTMFSLTLSGCTPEGVVGPQGEQGDVGPQGPQGDKGDTGDTGQSGKDGNTPYIGENGNWWIGNVDTNVPASGPKGDDGEQGPQGEPGNDGQNGQDGPAGKDGEDGLDGEIPYIKDGTWWIGDENTGVPATGPSGPKGDDGEQGSQGEPGNDGQNGQDGSAGKDGEDGLDGKSAYDLYCEAHPEYEGDEEQWLDDLINGRLGKKDLYQVTFVYNNGQDDQIIEVEDGKKCPKPEDPIFIGYVFDGWYNSYNEKWVFGGYSVTENITLNAHWSDDSAQYAPIIINEICSKNRYSFVDEYTEVPDWIELHNTSLHSINLVNCGFTDDLNQPYKFKFEDLVMQSDEYLVLCADKRPDNTKSEVHLPFTLSQKNGGTLYLISPTGELLQQVTFPGLKDDITFGRTDDGTYTTFYPTAGSKNEIVWVDNEILKQPKFSKNSGVYGSEFDLSLTSSEGEIYYTTDCSDPTIESTKYIGTIRIYDRSSEENVYANREDMRVTGYDYLPESPVDKCMVVKAIVLDNNGHTSPITTKSFWIDKNHYFEQGIGVASLSSDPDNLFGYEEGIYVSGKAYDDYRDTLDHNPNSTEMLENDGANFLKSGYESERIGDLSYFNHKGNLKCEQKVGIRIHGHYTRFFTKKSLRLYSRYDYDANSRFDYKFNDKKCEKIILRNGGNSLGFQLTDTINSEIAKEVDMQFDSQDFTATYLFLNGEFWGVYYIMDRYDDRYIEEKYDIEDHIMIKEGLVEEGFKTDSSLESEFYSMRKLDYTVEENFEKFMDFFDIDSFIDYSLFMTYIAISDWSQWSNMQMWASRNKSEKPYEDQKFRFMLYDTDMSLGLTSFGADYNIFETSKGTMDLLNALLLNSYFREYFSQKAYSFVEKMSKENTVDIANQIYQTYVDFVNEDCYRHLGTSHSVIHYNKIISFLTDRNAYYASHIDLLIS